MKLLIVRGLPGAGKTTYAKSKTKYNVAADDYFVTAAGRYFFDPRKLSAAHKWCQKRVEQFMESGHPLIAVHNTFSTHREIEPYLVLCDDRGYRAEVVHIQGDHGSIHMDRRTCERVRARMDDRWEPYPGETKTRSQPPGGINGL